MSVRFRILGRAGRDNALLVHVDSGQAYERLLFDCGEGCLEELSASDILAVDHLFFSHLHMDHVGGFDAFFRLNYNRRARPNRIWGPAETARIIQHRFQGFLWNLHEGMKATWLVSEVLDEKVRTARFELGEGFAVAHDEGAGAYDRVLLEGAGFHVEALTMDHRTPVLAYLVREKARWNFDASRLASLGLQPGPWMRQLKDGSSGAALLTVDGVSFPLEELRNRLLIETPGDSIAYLTDFRLDDLAMERLSEILKGCGTIVCEGQYRHADLELARKNFHMTTVQSATLARCAGVEKLVLFHLSSRYERRDWLEMLHEARQIFPNTHYPAHWQLDE
jgi:ribonuclease Z